MHQESTGARQKDANGCLKSTRNCASIWQLALRCCWSALESLGAVPEFTCNGGLLYVGSSVAELARFVFAPKLAPLFNKLCVSLLVSSAFCHIPERTLELFSSFMAFNSFSSLMTMDCQVDEDVHFLHPLLSAINEGFKANKAA
ncbi:hypothetical protein T4A_7488 [Trichinella pseudospiralis]|uniref:Uncharacterized protein n=1 Tax=Trichinella pseudospiralis TaxID=6337 RepID=A0A0V1EA52_TRIPS|nr:hypothetical protein T4A_7488 [Trichinella pseudospiralis]